MSQCVSRQRIPERRRPGLRRGDNTLRKQEGPGNLGEGAFLHHHLRVQCAHGLIVEPARKRGQCSLYAGIQIVPHQWRRMVGGKETEIVLQYPQVVSEQVAIRGVGVRDIDFAFQQRKVGEAVSDAAGGLRQSVPLLQARPTVGPVAEFVAESEPQLRKGDQVGYSPQTEARRGFAGHGDGIGIVEAQAGEQFHSEGRKPRVQFRFVQLHFGFENGLRQRAGVLGVGVDLARLKRLESDQRASQPRQAPDFETALLQHLRHHFREQVAFGEILASDGDGARLRAGCPGAAQSRDQQCDPERGYSGSPAPPAGAWRRGGTRPTRRGRAHETALAPKSRAT